MALAMTRALRAGLAMSAGAAAATDGEAGEGAIRVIGGRTRPKRALAAAKHRVSRPNQRFRGD